jgi:hypothetical protein
MNFLVVLDELVKLGAISDEQAQRSIDQLDALEKTKPTLGQVGRYGVLGAGAGMLGRTVSHGIEHGALPTRRALGGAAAAGAIGLGAVPIVRGALDRRANIGHLKKYMKQEHIGQFGKNPEPEGAPAKFEASGVQPSGPAGPASAI